MKTLESIKQWMNSNAKEVLDQLCDPASLNEIAQVEKKTGLVLPESFKSYLLLHNGEEGFSPILGDGNALLSCDQIVEQYTVERKECEISYEGLRQQQEWKEMAIDDRISIRGPVKPHHSHHKWLPITSMNGDVYRYLDFDPAETGNVGQVIEVHWPWCWRVIAPSFKSLLEKYIEALSSGHFKGNEHGDVERKEEYIEDPEEWGVPDWLMSTDDTPEYKIDCDESDWHLALRNFSVTREFLDSEFPIELEIFSWQDFEPSKIDPDYFDITWDDPNGGLYIAFASREIFSTIADKIKKKSQKMTKVKLKSTLLKHNDAGDRKSHSSWRCWIEVTKVELIEGENA